MRMFCRSDKDLADYAIEYGKSHHVDYITAATK